MILAGGTNDPDPDELDSSAAKASDEEDGVVGVWLEAVESWSVLVL